MNQKPCNTASIAAEKAILMARIGHSVILAAYVWFAKAEVFMHRRTEALALLFALSWAMIIPVHRHLLVLGAHCPLVPPFVGVCIAFSLALHSALPLDRRRVTPDLVSYALAVMAHAAACVHLPYEEAVRFCGLLGLGLALAVLLRLAFWLRANDGDSGDSWISQPALDAVLELCHESSHLSEVDFIHARVE